MPRFGLIGSFYKSRSITADCQELVNWYPEVIESGQGRSGAKMYLNPTPGLLARWTVPHGPSRASITLPHNFPGSDRVFVVNGPTLYELLSTDAWIDRGTVGMDATTSYPAFMASN